MKKNTFGGDIEHVRNEARRGITLERASRLAKPKVHTAAAVRRDKHTKTRGLLRSIGCLPHRDAERGYVYILAENMTPSHAQEAIDMRRKHISGLIRNSVEIAVTASRQSSLFEGAGIPADCMTLLDGAEDALMDALKRIRRERRKMRTAERRREKARRTA